MRGSPPQRSRRHRVPAELWAIAALTALAAVVRFATISSQSFWLDEALTAHEVRLPFGGMFSAVAHTETTPPLYYVLAWTWARLFGSGSAEIRSLSALAGTAVVPIAYLCGRELVSRRAGLVAAALVAVNPFMIWYSQEARSYMLLAALSAASFYSFARCTRRPSTRSVAWWAVFSTLALTTHFFAGFLVAPEAAALLWQLRGRAAIAVGAVAAAQVALLPLAVSDTSHGVQWIAAIPLSMRIKQVSTEFGLGTLYRSPIVTHGLLGAAIVLACVAALLAVAGEKRQRRGALVAWAVAAFVVLAPLALSQLGHDYFLTRNLIPAWVPLVTVLAAACTVPRAPILGGALATSLVLAFVLADLRIASHPEYQRPDWRGVAAALGTPDGQRAIVALPGVFAGEPLAYYLDRVPWPSATRAPVSVGELDVVANLGAAPAASLPAGVRLIASRQATGYEVARFSLEPRWRMSPAELGARAGALLGGQASEPMVLVQRAPSVAEARAALH